MAPLQPNPSWYRRFWYNERSPLDALVDRLLIFAIVALALLAGSTTLGHRAARSHHAATTVGTAAGR